ncbi:urease accessory protein UreF [Geodermatophilus obscurus]|uniref:Urease accessory protein UreF n=1 Tax=Geodermatophilus obscurus (strain ATCC 25078 / DSM 43160 / JCM 3152 / CCUG 61914 / KCC A-0152 / KCTC 9177 / NBRC 13315 / NRRL B-3577 / G-20) TaxID=526225 RepID=D2S3X0_GEOOG|nr:urease accessory UreF family protein [Geodermatophilus obscurus]ADB72998.1 urease accessory protein UreF [Geodermatophilus obscurus DSM 43160]
MTAALLTLADSRLPAGGHTHSGGVEQAVAAGVVHDPGSLTTFLLRRLHTAGVVAAGLAAAATTVSSSGRHRGQVPSPAAESAAPVPGLRVVGRTGSSCSSRETAAPASSSLVAALLDLDAEADARTPSPALRAASRQQGRGLVRVGRRAWPSPVWDALPDRPHHPVAMGVAGTAAGLAPSDAAAAAAYLSISGPATAAQRLLAMDPLTVAAVTARLARAVDAVAVAAVEAGLPADADPLLDLLAEVHAARKDRFFAS